MIKGTHPYLAMIATDDDGQRRAVDVGRFFEFFQSFRLLNDEQFEGLPVGAGGGDPRRMIQFKNNVFNCTMELAIELIGGRYKALILWHLLDRTLRFNELRRLIPHATQKMLTQQLRSLEEDGLIIRKVYAEVPPKVEYSLSQSGKNLKPVLEAMCQFGRTYVEEQGLKSN
ncbi:winged helix-turn-helix transcriptional regulator [Heliomicrobium undosum]